MYAAAKEEGALGGKLLGAGGGGFLLVYADPEAHDRIKKRLNEFLAIHFRFEAQGSHLLYAHHG
jgi:D-glycero-alpha-D-manno-heptose-7-phosphate kinase